MKQSSLNNKKYLIITISVVLVIWQGIAKVVGNALVFPSIIDVLISMADILKEKGFILLILTSSYRSIISLFIAAIVSIVAGILAYYNNFLFNMFRPIIAFVKSVPTMAFVVLLLIWTSKEYVPIVIGVVISLPIFYEMIINSLINIDEKMIQLCNVYNISLLNKINNVIIPIILFSMKNILNSTLSLIFKVVISAEVYSQPKYGIGTAIQSEKINLNTAGVIAWMIIIIIIVYLMDYLLKIVDKRWIRRNE